MAKQNTKRGGTFKRSNAPTVKRNSNNATKPNKVKNK